MRAYTAVPDCHAIVFLAQISGGLPATVSYSGVVFRGRSTGTVAAIPPSARHANLNNCNVQGALGCSTVSDNYEPEEVNLPKDTAKVAAGHYHSLAINGDGKLWSWGYVYNACALSCSNGRLFCADQQCSSQYDKYPAGEMLKDNLDMAYIPRTLSQHQQLWKFLLMSGCVPYGNAQNSKSSNCTATWSSMHMAV